MENSIHALTSWRRWTCSSSVTYLGFALLVLMLSLARLEDPLHQIPTVLTWYFAAFAVYAVAVVYLLRLKPEAGLRESGSSPLLAWIVLVAVLARVPFLTKPRHLSSDLYRYVWDGKMTNQGINPYLYAPSDPEVAQWRDPLWKHINFKRYSTIYPPASQVVFALAYRLRPASPVAFKWMFFGFDMGTLLILLLLLKRSGRPLCYCLLYAWNPLVILEIAGNGHQEILGIFFLTAAVWVICGDRPRNGWGGVLFSLSVLTKGYSLLLLPLLGWRNRRQFWLACVLTSLAVTIPFLGAGSGLFAGLGAYATHWQGNDSLFSVLRIVCLPFSTNSFLAAQVVAGLILIGAIVKVSRDLGNMQELIAGTRAQLGGGCDETIARACLIVLLCFFLLSPTVYPWYLTWLAPFLVLVPSLSAFLFTGLVALGYTWYLQHEPLLWARWVEYLPVYLVLGWEMWRCWKRKT